MNGVGNDLDIDPLAPSDFLEDFHRISLLKAKDTLLAYASMAAEA
jgi:hypothetical protein